jgi:hypothetical protein
MHVVTSIVEVRWHVPQHRRQAILYIDVAAQRGSRSVTVSENNFPVNNKRGIEVMDRGRWAEPYCLCSFYTRILEGTFSNRFNSAEPGIIAIVQLC